MRLGLFGGTFNPVHDGHLMLAESAREQLRLDQVWFIPTAMPPHKRIPDLADGRRRLAMIRLAIHGNPAFRACDLEIRRGGVSYSLDTVRAIRRKHPRARLFFIIGSDMLRVRWYGMSELRRLCTFVVAGGAPRAKQGRSAPSEVPEPRGFRPKPVAPGPAPRVGRHPAEARRIHTERSAGTERVPAHPYAQTKPTGPRPKRGESTPSEVPEPRGFRPQAVARWRGRPVPATARAFPGAREVRMPALAISSSEIRRRARRGLSLRYWLPEAVAGYIKRHKLYRGSRG